MQSYILGFIGLLVSFVAILLIIGFPDKQKTKRIYLWSIIAFISSIILYFIISLFSKPPVLETSIFETIIFTLLITPLFEEILYRRIIFQHFININKFESKYILKGFLIGISLIIPTLLLYLIGFINVSKFSLLFFILFFSILPSLAIFIYKKDNKFKSFVYYLIILFSQTMIFVLMHGDYAAKMLIVMGLFYGVLYLASKSFVPSLTAHYTINLLIFLKQIGII